jgi:hypothetical protein
MRQEEHEENMLGRLLQMAYTFFEEAYSTT